ncbi:MAG: hypothetical protein J6T99_00955 [Oscillospiraceae bacterium]|nr:hypothetical protein [Lentisphaeria bacterium]MBO7421941.1 hypothetical protein [Oscillospiraceae bacterium]
MPDVKLPDAALSWESIVYVIALIVVVAGILAALVKGWEAWKKISVRDRVKRLEEDMEAVKHRLEVGNKRFKSQGEDMGQILQTLNALQVHFITGNDHERLRESNDQLVAYMNKRAQRDAEEV